jgi:hypothetical protein
MKRLVALALIFSVGPASAALAGEGLLESASRLVRAQVQSSPVPNTVSPAQAGLRAPKRSGDAVRSNLQAPQGQPAIETARWGKGRKFAVALGIAAGFVGILYAIDHSVEDNTPSSLGQR